MYFFQIPIFHIPIISRQYSNKYHRTAIDRGLSKQVDSDRDERSTL